MNEDFLVPVKNLPDVFYRTDLDGRILFISSVVEKDLGYTAEELLGTKPDALYINEDQEQDFFQQLKENGGKLSGYQAPLRHQDGSTVWMSISAAYYYDQDGNIAGVEGIGRNITTEHQAQEELERYRDNLEKMVAERTAKLEKNYIKRRQAEESARESKKDLRALSDLVPQSICEVDMAGVITYANKSAFKFFGYAEADLAGGLKMLDHVIPDDREQAASRMQSLMRGEIEMTTGEEYAVQRKDGSTFPVLIYSVPLLESGKPVGLRILLVDISVHKRAEEEKNRLLKAIEQAAETFVITDAEAKIQYVNPAFERLTGYTRAEAIGRNPRVLQSGEHDQAFYEKMWHKLLHGEVWRGHLVNKRKNGAVFEEDATISPIKNAAGEITNFVAVKRDVSREVLLEKQLQQARKMESIGTLAGGIAHDFNNILTAILGYAEMVKVDLPADSKAGNRIDKVISAGERAADLVQQILTFSRQETQDLQSLMPAPIIKEALKMMRSTLPATTIMEEDIDFDCGLISADVTQVHQIVLNLCTNAFQALENEKGTISVKLQRVEVAAEEIAVEPGVEAGEFIVLSVSDTGSGIDPSMIERIFEPYFTTKELGDGTGLGLAVIHGIVKRYHGFIRTESQPGRGTSFHVYIPVQKKRIVIIAEAEEAQTLPTGRERILVVDDEEAIFEFYEMMLKQLGYKVTSTASSQDALEKIRIHPDNFDLLITDQSMPDLSGAELAREVLKIKPYLPIIICTGYSSVLSEAESLSLGIKKYVDKPVKQKELARIVRQVLKKEEAPGFPA